MQYETKKGKWSKRFLETRGGQVFVSKNDKVSFQYRQVRSTTVEQNKEEFQINTLFFDVFTSNRSHSAPKPFVFVLKRRKLINDPCSRAYFAVEPAKAFEDPKDFIHIFAAEESIGFKLAAAIFDAKVSSLAPRKRPS